MDKRYYSSAEVMDIFGIRPGNYTTFGKLCRDLKLPRIRVGKMLLFPIKPFDERLKMVEKEKMQEFLVRR